MMFFAVKLLLLVINIAVLNASRDFDSDRQLLGGMHFIIGTIEYPPYISYKLDSKGVPYDIGGYVYEIALYIAEKYEFTYEYIESPAWGALVNGSWNGLIGLLQQKEIDLTATGLSVTYARSQVVDFCIPYMNDPVSLLIPYPELDSTISGISRPFHYEVWILIVISCIACAFALWLISLVEFSWLKKTIAITTFKKHFWALFSILANAGARIPTSLPIRLVASVWCLVSVVFLNAYTSILTSYLMAPRFHAMVNSIEDIATIPRPTFMVQKYGSFESDILGAEPGTTLAKIAESITKYPKELLLPNDNGVADLVTQHKRTFTQEESTLLALIEKDLKDTGTCRLSLAKKSWDMSQTSFALRKSNQATHIFNIEIIWLRQVGLLDHWRRQFWPRPNRCSDQLARLQTNSKTKLSLYYLSSVFLLLGSGIAISCFVFLIEILVPRNLF